MTRIFSWCSENGTRYELLYGKVLGDDDYFIVGLFDPYQPSKATTYRFSGYVHWTHLFDNMNLNDCDGTAVLSFLKDRGHEVGFPSP